MLWWFSETSKEWKRSKLTMSDSLLKMLKSMADVDRRDPDFLIKSGAKLTSADVKYPDNLIVVVSPSGPKPPPLLDRERIRVEKLSSAIRFACDEAAAGRGKNFSIVVYEGICSSCWHDV